MTWNKFTVLVEMKDGSIRGVKTEIERVEGSLTGRCRIHDEGIGRDQVRRIIGNVPGWEKRDD